MKKFKEKTIYKNNKIITNYELSKQFSDTFIGKVYDDFLFNTVNEFYSYKYSKMVRDSFKNNCVLIE